MAQAPATARPPLQQLATQLRESLGPIIRFLRRTGDGRFTPTQVSVLGTVHRYEPIRIGDIASRECLSPATVSAAVAALENDGAISRSPDPSDRRVWLIVTTKAGQAWISESRAARDTLLSRRLAQLSREEIEVLAAALPVLERFADPAP